MAKNNKGTKKRAAQKLGAKTATSSGPAIVQANPGHDKPVNCLAFAPNGRILASGSNDGTVCLWDTRTGERLAVQPKGEHKWAAVAVAFAPDGYALVSLREGFKGPDKGFMQPHHWHLLSGRVTELARKDKFGYQFTSPTFPPAGDVVALGGSAIQLFDTRSGDRIGEPFKNSACNDLAFTPDGACLVAAHRDGTIGVWDVAKGKRVQELSGHTEPVRCLACSPGGKFVASADDESIRVWRFQSGQERHALHGAWGIPRHLTFLPGGQRLTSLHEADDGRCTLRLWGLGDGEELGAWTPKTSISSVAVSYDGKTLATGGTSGAVELWELGAVLGGT